MKVCTQVKITDKTELAKKRAKAKAKARLNSKAWFQEGFSKEGQELLSKKW